MIRMVARMLCAVTLVSTLTLAESADMPTSVLNNVVKDIDDKDHDLSQYKGKVVLIVNVASKCGFTKQYAGLEKLYQAHKDKGLVVIGFPANNFGGQEPGSNEEIKEFCSAKFDVTFPMMAKISVKGDDKHPVYKFLTEKETAGEHAGEIKWNFNKFLIGRDGKIIARYDSKVAPESEQMTKAIEAALGSE
jgi:glutathione peroxidase